MLKIATKEHYVHVSISLDKDLENHYSFGRKYIYFPLPGGLVKEDVEISSIYFKTYSCKIYEMELTDNQYNQLKKDLEDNYLTKKNKYKYNLIGLPLIQFNKEYRRTRHFTCSQFCGKLLIENEIVDFKKNYSIIKPQDFLKLNNTKQIFEGKITEYLKIKKTNN